MLSGIILAGGTSSRMSGENKSLLMVGNETLIERQVRIMRGVCSEVIVVTNTPRAFLRKVDESVRIITDYIPNKGPLSGYHAGLTLTQKQYAWIVGCDMPLLSPEAAELMLRKLNSGLDAVIPVVHGNLHPLHGIYDRSCAHKIGTMLLNNDTQLQSLGRTLKWQSCTESEFGHAGIGIEFLKAIKTHGDYKEMQAKMATITI